MNEFLSNNDVIVLDDSKQYVVVEQVIYENNRYAYLCELGNLSNIKFVQIEDNNMLSIISKDETVLLEKLIILFSRKNKNFNM